jgi:hypothetical protein
MNAQQPSISYDTTQYHSKRDFIMQAMDPSNTIRDAVRSGEWTLHNASEEAADYIRYIIDLDFDREALASMESGEDAERMTAKLDGTLTVEDLESYIIDLIAEHAE